jgi:hypothetical protein
MFLTWAWIEVEYQHQAWDSVRLGTANGMHCIGRWVGPRATWTLLRTERRQAMYVQYNMDAAFAYPLLPWKSSNYYIFCVSVALVIQHAMRMRSIIQGVS